MTKQARFVFSSYGLDIQGGSLSCSYELTHGDKQILFTERIAFRPPDGPIGPERELLAQRIARQLHLLLGISYWKTFCPRDITVSYPLASSEAEFFRILYTKGLGEFFYRNTIDFRGLVSFPSDGETPPLSPGRVKFSSRSLVLLGAGKDSIVTGELLKKHRKNFALFTLNPTPIHEAVASQMGVTLLTMKRTIDPKLMDLNAQPGTYNGHVPITSIFMCTGMLAAALYDFQYVIASNEESANYGNVEYLGEEMNHQWSKSLEFESMFASHAHRNVSPDLGLFSLLRPFTEREITGTFSSYPQYFHSFTSCNTNFKITGDPRRGQWCGTCPKCAFVFLLLSEYLPRETVVDIFGKSLFDDAALLPVYRELLGLEGFKPFECVGTPQEATSAFMAVMKRGEFAQDAVVASLAVSLKPLPADSYTPHHFVPPEFDEIIRSV